DLRLTGPGRRPGSISGSGGPQVLIRRSVGVVEPDLAHRRGAGGREPELHGRSGVGEAVHPTPSTGQLGTLAHGRQAEVSGGRTQALRRGKPDPVVADIPPISTLAPAPPTLPLL